MRAVAVGSPVAVVGGGPVGLYLACRLAVLGVPATVIEERPAPGGHSRAIGIHPPALEALAAVGLAERLTACGARVTRARAYSDGRLLGTLDLGGGPAPYPFVLTVPQPVTEALLAARLEELAPGALVRGRALTGLRQDADGVTLELSGGERLRAPLALGCDGRRSATRHLAGIGTVGGPHRDAYLMADLADTTGFGAEAAIFLTRTGVVESFPLPGGQRRWVARTGGRVGGDLESLRRLVRARTGLVLPGRAGMVSAFGIETLAARRLARGRVALAGDAAHVVPPIGGQGLNLGWLGADRLARAVAAGLAAERPEEALVAYARRQTVAFARAARRARLNVWLGRPWERPWLRDHALGAVLGRRLGPVAARFFTMRGL